jgi:nickel transport protein
VRRSTAALLAAIALLALPAAARAHEVLHEVQRGRAVALHAWFPDGESLAYVQAEVFSPADGKIPYWKGRTDRNGWLAFVPDVPGSWRVRVIDSTGHGLDTTVEVPVSGTPESAPARAAGTEPSGVASFAFVLRPVLGVALIAAIFGLLFLRGRRSKK